MTDKLHNLAQIEDYDEDNIMDMYLTFNLNEEIYAVGIQHVTEVVGMQDIVEVPDVPPYIKGVINLRGKVITVMDMRLRFKMPHRDYDERTCIIVLDINEVLTGLVVDGVSEVIEISPSQIDAPPKRDKGDSQDNTVMGMGKHDDFVSIILDANKLVGNHSERNAVADVPLESS
ncbi:MAG: chemotaxis protein CheW [Gammaproteobacteria bacterium]